MQVEERNVRERVVEDGSYVQRRRVTEVAPPTSQVLLARTKMFIWLVTGIVVAIIAFRFVLLLIGANPGSGFVDFVYNVSGFFVGPFLNITGNPTYQGAVFEVASLFAMVVYPLIAWVLIRLLYILFKAPPGAREVETYERH